MARSQVSAKTVTIKIIILSIINNFKLLWVLNVWFTVYILDQSIYRRTKCSIYDSDIMMDGAIYGLPTITKRLSFNCCIRIEWLLNGIHCRLQIKFINTWYNNSIVA